MGSQNFKNRLQMLNKYSTSFRNLDQSEFYFISKEAMEFVQLSFELESSKFTSNFLDQLKQSVAGLYSRCDGYKLYSINRNPDDIKVHRIPSQIKSLKEVNEWMHEQHTPDISDHLAEIGSDEHRVVINSSHICSDGGYLASLIKGIQTQRGLPQHPKLPGSIVDILQCELKKADEKKNIKIAGFDEVTFLTNQKVDPTVPELSKAHIMTATDDVRNLACYDMNKDRPSGLTEHMWCALTLSFCALNDRLGPIGISTCVDFRRFVFPQTRISNSMTNFFGCINVVAGQINSQSLRISDVSKMFRNHFNYIIESDALFYSYLHPVELKDDVKPIAHLSNIGPIKYKSPIKDFEISLRLNQKAQQQSAQVMSYSKLKIDESGENVISNDIHYQLAYSPANISDRLGRIIFQSFQYFMRNIKPSMLLNDAYNEMKRFQSTL